MRIFNVNTGKIIEAVVQTPGGEVEYDGDATIDGVPGSGAPIVLNFLDAAGAKTGKLLPTGSPLDVVDGVEVSCVDLSSPLVFVPAAALGKTGYETKAELDADVAFIARLESLRQQAARLMGMGDVSGKVLPKFALVAPPRAGGTVCSRYFVPWSCHAAYAVTGALCLGAAATIPGTIVARVAQPGVHPDVVIVEHPAGKLETRMTTRKVPGSDIPIFDRAGIVRTARPLLSGVVHIPDDVWDNVRPPAEGQGAARASP